MVREGYLEVGDVRARREFTRVRSGTSSLRVEMGRREGLKREERLCRVCGDGVEDEEHLLMDCDLYSDLRVSMVRKLGWKEKWKDARVRKVSLVKLLESTGVSGSIAGRQRRVERQQVVMEFVGQAMRRRNRILGTA